MNNKIKIGFAPTRRSIFSAPDAIKYANLTRAKLDELGIVHTTFYDVAPDPSLACAKEGAKAMMGVFPAQERVAAERTIVLVQRLSRMREELKALTEKVRELSDSH